jgi:hypothetical protein
MIRRLWSPLSQRVWDESLEGAALPCAAPFQPNGVRPKSSWRKNSPGAKRCSMLLTVDGAKLALTDTARASSSLSASHVHRRARRIMPYGSAQQAKTSDEYLTVQWNGVTVDDATPQGAGTNRSIARRRWGWAQAPRSRRRKNYRSSSSPPCRMIARESG